MQALFIIITEPDTLQDILTGLLEEGVTRATIMESQGMGGVVMDRLSIFAGFRDLWSGNLGYGHTLVSVVEDDQVDDIVRSLQDILADGEDAGRAVLFTMPVSRFERLKG